MSPQRRILPVLSGGWAGLFVATNGRPTFPQVAFSAKRPQMRTKVPSAPKTSNGLTTIRLPPQILTAAGMSSAKFSY